MRSPTFRAYFSGLALAALLGGLALSAQEIRQPTLKVLKQKREEYQQSMEEWQNGDKNLELDLHTRSRDELLKRIDAEAVRTKKLLETKQAYFETLRTYYQEQYLRLEGSTGSNAKPPETREDLQQHIDSIGREYLELEDRIKRAPNSAVQEKMLRQQVALEDLQKNLQRQKALVERWEQAEGGIAESRKAVLANLRSIMEVLQKQEAGSAETTKQMDRFYESMRESAGTPTRRPAPVTVAVSPQSARLGPGEKHQFTASVTGGAPAVRWSIRPALGSISDTGLYTAPASIAAAEVVTVTAAGVADPNARATARIDLAPASAPPPPPPPPGGGSPAAITPAAGVTGSWVYLKHAPNTPASLQVQLVEKDGRVTGDLEALQVPKSMGLPATVKFSFEGPKNGRLRWTLQGRKEAGTVELNLANGEMELTIRNDAGGVIFDDFMSRVAGK